MGYLICVCMIVGLAAGLAALLPERRFEELAAPAVFLTIGILLIAGLLGALPAGVYLSLALSAAGAVWFVLRVCTHKNANGIARLFTPGFFAFLCAAAAAYLVSRPLIFRYWDEFSHWGLVLKNMVRLDAFGNAPGATTIYAAYPPAISLWQYLVMKLSGGFSENLAYAALWLLDAALVLPALKWVHWNRWWAGMIACAALVLVPAAGVPEFYTRIYVDGTMGLLLGYMLYIWFGNAESGTYRLYAFALAGGILALTKDAGAVLALLAAGTAIADAALTRRAQRRLGKAATFNPVHIACAAAVMAAGPLAWRIHLAVCGTQSVRAINHFTSAYEAKLVLKNALFRFLEPQTFGAVPLSYLMWAGLIAAAGLLLWQLSKDADSKRRTAVLTCGVLAGFFLYAAAVAAAYLFAFNHYEAEALESFERYLNTYLAGAVFVYAALLMEQGAGRGRALTAAALAVCALLPLTPVKETVQALIECEERKGLRAPYTDAEAVLGTLDPETDRVCLISQGSNTFDRYMIQYLITPTPVSVAYAASIRQKIPEEDYWSADVSPEDWMSETLRQGCTHVYIYQTDGQFDAAFGSLFADGEIPENGALYRIVPCSDATFVLERVSAEAEVVFK